MDIARALSGIANVIGFREKEGEIWSKFSTEELRTIHRFLWLVLDREIEKNKEATQELKQEPIVPNFDVGRLPDGSTFPKS